MCHAFACVLSSGGIKCNLLVFMEHLNLRHDAFMGQEADSCLQRVQLSSNFIQFRRVMQQLREDCSSDLQRYELLAQLQASNETLFYNVVMKHIKELAPVIYTPTVGKACQDFDRIYRCDKSCRQSNAPVCNM